MLDKFRYITVAGHHFIKSDASTAMGITWMTNKELSQAIPPAYTEWLGKQMLKLLYASKEAKVSS